MWSAKWKMLIPRKWFPTSAAFGVMRPERCSKLVATLAHAVLVI